MRSIRFYYDLNKGTILELWGSSTKHPDVTFNMEDHIEKGLFARNLICGSSATIYQWLVYCASRMTWVYSTREILEFAEEFRRLVLVDNY